MAFGRPTNYTDEMLQKAMDYVTKFDEIEDEIVPTVVGLSRYIGRSRQTIYEWCSHPEKADFSDIVKQVEDMQHLKLISGGLGGTMNHSITKLMLTKHGYSDKQEIDMTSREEVTPWGDIQSDE